jgi:hypothetical protein
MIGELSAMAGNLMWTRGGVVWAVWRLRGLPYGYRSDDAKAEVRAAHTALLRGLRGEGLLLGVCAQTDPAELIERMMRGLEIERHPQWAAECVATLDQLEDIQLARRVFYLAVPLSNAGSGWAEPVRAAWSGFADALALPRGGPSVGQVEARRAQAARVEQEIPRVFGATPASVAEVVWLHVHAQQRGLRMDLGVPDVPGGLESQLQSGAVVPSALLDPCGTSDDGKKALSPTDVLARRYLKVVSADTGTPSYQVMLAVAGVPSGGVVFPGGEWIGRVEECGEEIDWAIRLTIRQREEVSARNRRASTQLADQTEQRVGEQLATGGQLGIAAEALGEYQALIDSDELEVEVESTTIFAVGAPTPAQAMDKGRMLTKFFASAQFRLVTDPTAQEALWWASLPGTSTPRAVRELSQVTTAHNFAAAVPLITTELGDEQGSLLAFETSAGQPRPVLVDLAGAGSTLDVAMAVAFVGELGAGKSLACKRLALDAVDRGATLTAIDRTDMGEWSQAVAGMPGSVSVEITERAQFSIDPLRLFGSSTGSRVARSFLIPLLRLPAGSDEEVLLGEVLESKYLDGHQIDSLPGLLAHLADECKIAGAKALARRIRGHARLDFAAAIFDPSLPAVDLDAAALVFRTHQLKLPKTDELNSSHRFAQMSVEKIFGRAVYALIMSIARHRCFADRTRLDILAADETHGLTASPEAEEELGEFIRDGRKHKAGVILGSHDAEEDFGGEVLRGLIPFRVLMRHRDANLAVRGLRWLYGLKPDQTVAQELIDLISQGTSPVTADGTPFHRRGECLIRDFQARYGRGKVLLPFVPERAEAVLTTPDQDVAR